MDIHELLEIHEKIILHSGGLNGVRDRGLLESCLDFIKNDEYYPTFDDKFTHLVFTIAKNHAFVDGNKRSSIGAGAYFLLLNDYPTNTSKLLIDKLECLILHVVKNEFTKDEFKQIISDYIHSGSLSPASLQLYEEKSLDPNEIPS